MKTLRGLSSNSSLPGGNSRPGDVPPGLNRVKRKKNNSITSRKSSKIKKPTTPVPKTRNSGKVVIRKKRTR